MNTNVPRSQTPGSNVLDTAIQVVSGAPKKKNLLNEPNILKDLPLELLQKVFGFMHFDPSRPQSLYFVDKSLFQQMMGYAARESIKAMNFARHLGESLKLEFPEQSEKITNEISSEFKQNGAQSRVEDINTSILSLREKLLEATQDTPKKKLVEIETVFAKKSAASSDPLAGKLPVLFGTFSEIGPLLRELWVVESHRDPVRRSDRCLTVGQKFVKADDLHAAHKLAASLLPDDAELLTLDIALGYAKRNSFEEAHQLLSRIPQTHLCARSLAPICQELYSRGGLFELRLVLNRLSEKERPVLFCQAADVAIRKGRLDELRTLEELMPQNDWGNPPLLILILRSFVDAKLWSNGLSFIKERVHDDFVVTFLLGSVLERAEDRALVPEVLQSMPLREYVDLFAAERAIRKAGEPISEYYMTRISDVEIRGLVGEFFNAHMAEDHSKAMELEGLLEKKHLSIFRQLLGNLPECWIKIIDPSRAF